jgi:hypothetical protein
MNDAKIFHIEIVCQINRFLIVKMFFHFSKGVWKKTIVKRRSTPENRARERGGMCSFVSDVYAILTLPSDMTMPVEKISGCSTRTSVTSSPQMITACKSQWDAPLLRENEIQGHTRRGPQVLHTRGDFLNTVKISKTHEVIIVPMCPYDCIYLW